MSSKKQNNLQGFTMMMGTHPDSIDETLYQEDKDIIQLEYDRASKMLALSSASFLGSTALAISLSTISTIGYGFFLITSTISFIRSYYWNIKMNTYLNTLKKKMKEGKFINK